MLIATNVVFDVKDVNHWNTGGGGGGGGYAQFYWSVVLDPASTVYSQKYQE